MGVDGIRVWSGRRMGMTGRRESESAARTRYVHGGSGEDRKQCEQLPKESDGQKEKMYGTREKNTI